MKKWILIILALGVLLLAACGGGGGGDDNSDGGGGGKPDDPPAVINTVDFSCLSVDNDQVCTGVLNAPGIWNSGPVAVTGSPLPDDYLNLEVTNNLAVNATVFAYSLVTISGCGDNPIAFDAVTLAPGDAVVLDYQLWNDRCGMLGDQQTEVMLYNAAGFDPAAYANPWMYPRIDLIANAVVTWDNRLHGDMP